MIFSFVFPISGTEWKDKESGTKVVQGTKRVHFKCIPIDGGGKSDGDDDKEGKCKGGKGDGNDNKGVGQGMAPATKRAIATGMSEAGDEESAGNRDCNCNSD
jgi:hypothetical protein